MAMSLQFPYYPLHSQYVEEETLDETQPLEDSAYNFQVTGVSSFFPPYKNERTFGLTSRSHGPQMSPQVNWTQLEETAAIDLRPFVPRELESITNAPLLWMHENHGHYQAMIGEDMYAPLPLQPSIRYQHQGREIVKSDSLAGHATVLPMPSTLNVPQAPSFSLQEPKERRKLCCEEGCKSQARALGRCKRHGGSKRCMSSGCDKSVQSRGLCIRHGGGSRCRESGCTRASQSFGKCKLHGGGRPCSIKGCQKGAHLKRLCRQHGGGIKCCIIECQKWAQRQGMCMKHVKEVLQSDAFANLKH
ncbi:hypothetical protein Plhal304r1_c019g0067601 [Plasmopara halstedii]